MKISIIEDDVWYAEFLKHHLSKNPDYEVEIFNDGSSFLKQSSSTPDIVTLDYNLPDYSGSELLDLIIEKSSTINVIIISEQKDLKIATDLIKKGAIDYIIKDEDTASNIWNSCIRASRINNLQNEVNDLKVQINEKFNLDEIVGNSEKIENLKTLIKKSSIVNIPVSITGETGTGKELIAKSIHTNSEYKNKEMITVNISALNPNLIESELFGHEAGAFTGANKKHIGLFEKANNNNIFLDEIAELQPDLQVKLLRVLQEKKFRRIGGDNEIKSNFRLITATHKNLAKEVKEGRFREDLFYRIKGLTIESPPLRDRGNDIIILAKYFKESFCKENKISKPVLTNEAKEKLLKYHFPGNVRELKSIIELACVMSEDKIYGADLEINNLDADKIIYSEMTMKEYEMLIINNLLKKYKNVKKVAQILDIGKSTIYRLISSDNNKFKLEDS